MRLVYIALGWTAGIVLSANSQTHQPILWLTLVALAIIAAALLWRDWRIVAISLVALTLGGLRLSLVPTTSPIAAYNHLGGLTIEGVIVDAPDVRDYYTVLRVSAETVTRAGATLDEAFFAATQAQLVILQNDSASRHENPDVLALVGNTPLFRTDPGGTIHLWTDGHSLWSMQER